jgi:hypothetical protein
MIIISDEAFAAVSYCNTVVTIAPTFFYKKFFLELLDTGLKGR